MEGLCTSQNCKILLLIFVVFLAGYLIAINDESKRRHRSAEHFKDDPSGEYLSLEPAPAPPAATTEEAQRVLAKIDKVYREVYGEPVPADKMSLYFKSLGASDFDEGAFKRRVSFERKAMFEQRVKDVYADVLKRPPTPSELQKNIDAYMRNEMRTPADLENILKLDVEIAARSKAAAAVAERPPLKEQTGPDYAKYKMVISTYQEILDRHPSTDELQFYYDMAVQPGFTQEKLRNILISSREHDILSKNQSNQVFGDLEANITEKQLELAINEIYRAVHQQYPDDTTYKFLRTKFVEFNLDEEKLARYVRLVKMAEDGVGEPAVAANAVTTTPAPIQGMDDIARTQLGSQRTTETFADAVPSVSEFVMANPARAVTNTRQGNIQQPTSAPSKIGDALRAERGTPEPVFAPPPQAPLSFEGDNQTMIRDTLAKINSERTFDRRRFENMRDLRDRGVKRNEPSSTSKYVNASDDMVLRPEFQWEVPMRRAPVCYATEAAEYKPDVIQTSLIGTLLEDANQTKVGSIMPKFEYKEIL